MSERFFQLKSQAGSVLAGVLALSMAMTAIAGGYVLIAGSTAGRSVDAMDDLRLHYAAEAGEQLGNRWLQQYAPQYYSMWGTPTADTPPLWTQEIPISPDGFQIGNCDVLIKAVPSLHSSHGNFQIYTRATLGPHRDTLVITWGVNLATSVTGPTQSRLSTDYWYETYKPGKP